MTRIAIDATSFVRWADSHRPIGSAHQLVAPHSLRVQSLGVLLEQVRAGVLAESHARTLHERMTRQKVRLLGDRVTRATTWSYAITDHAVDLETAEFVAIARLQADVIVAEDPRIAALASRLGVTRAPFEQLFDE